MARSSERLKSMVGVAFSTSNRVKAKIKIKTFNNKTIDDLLDCDFTTPGIPSSAVIKEVVIGEDLVKKMINRYK
jgi:hypothetical protein